jgi:hypothetical protein
MKLGSAPHLRHALIQPISDEQVTFSKKRKISTMTRPDETQQEFQDVPQGEIQVLDDS